MTIPVEIQEVIRLAKIQEIEEGKLDTYRAQKADHQAAIAELNTQITNQVTVVQAARAALKAAAQSI